MLESYSKTLQKSGLDMLMTEKETINQGHDITEDLKVVDFNLQEFRETLWKIHDPRNVSAKMNLI